MELTSGDVARSREPHGRNTKEKTLVDVAGGK
jgi:hypothetical protein